MDQYINRFAFKKNSFMLTCTSLDACLLWLSRSQEGFVSSICMLIKWNSQVRNLYPLGFLFFILFQVKLHFILVSLSPRGSVQNRLIISGLVALEPPRRSLCGGFFSLFVFMDPYRDANETSCRSWWFMSAKTHMTLATHPSFGVYNCLLLFIQLKTRVCMCVCVCVAIQSRALLFSF